MARPCRRSPRATREPKQQAARGALVRPPPAYGKRQKNAARGRRAVLCASLLRPARLLERSMDRQAAVSSKIAKRDDRASTNLASSGTPIPLNASRERFSLTGSRSVDLIKGLSSPLLCAPARRPAHLLGYLASPRLGCSAPAWHLPGTCLAPTWHLLGTCFGAPL
jgi:hypothetical protein